MKYEFPKGFYWGTATSSHQVEGGNNNDWTEWEKSKPEIKESGKACGHYNRYEKDFDITRELGHNAHRFSIEWSRIEPKEGKFDEKEIEHYQKVINALRMRGIEPFVTLYHWTVPIWFRDKGGWLSKESPKYFERYVKEIVSKLTTSQDVNFWITINEPNVYASNSFLRGVWPPQNKSIFKYFKVLRNLAEAHKKSYKIIKEINSQAQVGISKNNIYFEYNSFSDYFWNKYFLNKIKEQQDFIGFNYYFHSCLFGNKNKSVTDMGREIYPEGIYHTLKDLKKYEKPIYITENGLADAKDEKRAEFIKEHLRWIHKAISEDTNVRGYFYWSLLDNFEWDKGFWPRFGLVEIDYKTMERKIRQSAYEYAKICKSNVLEYKQEK